ncbi:cytochrome c biogenesis protein CcsA [Bacillaceae bacterium W0354]
MDAIESIRVYEGIVIFYALSVILYFYDFFQHDRKARRMAFWLLLVVWSIQTIFLFIKIYQSSMLPVLNLQEGLYFFVWLIVLVSIVIHYLFKNDTVVFLINIIGFILMVLFLTANVSNYQSEYSELLIGELLIAHIVIAFLAYTLYTLAFAFSVLYLIKFYVLKKKKWTTQIKRFGSLEQLEYVTSIFIIFATAVLVISLILGISWGYLTHDHFYWLDSKTVGSFFVVILYSYILIKKLLKQILHRHLAYWNISAYIFILINFLLLSKLSNFHFV